MGVEGRSRKGREIVGKGMKAKGGETKLRNMLQDHNTVMYIPVAT